MIDFQPTDEELAIIGSVRAFVQRELMPYEQVLLERGINGGNPHLTAQETRALRATAKSSGLWGLDTPEEYGGVDLGWVTQALVQMELSYTFVDFFLGGSAPEVMYLANEDQKQRYLLPTIADEKLSCFALSEPGGGSDVRNMKTTAVRDGSDWIINGEKMWISFADEADYALVFCRTPDEPEGGITAFLVDHEMGFKAARIPMMGGHDPSMMSLVDVRVPEENRFGDVGAGLSIAMRFIHRNRCIVLPGRQIGASTRLVEMGLKWAQERVTMGKPLIERENVRFALAESEVEIRAMKLLTLHAAWTHDSGGDPRQAANVVKYFGANGANRIVDRVLQMHGGMGYAKELPIERYYRDLRLERIYEGADEMQLQSIIRNLVKGHNKVGQLW